MIRTLAVLAALCLAGCDLEEDNPERPDSGGVNVADTNACRAEDFENVQLTHCFADPVRHRIAMVLGPPGGAPYRSFSALAAAEPDRTGRIAFAMNGGMYDDEGKPIGYYVEGGQRRQRLNRAKGPGNFHLLPNGVFFGSGAQWSVLSAERFATVVKERPEFGTQSGPMLVIGGKLHPGITHDGQSRYVRNAVGVDRQGRAHFVISQEPLSFGKLARYFRDKLKVPNALFLDGNVSALWHPGSGRIDGLVPLGPLIVVENRAKAAAEKAPP